MLMLFVILDTSNPRKILIVLAKHLINQSRPSPPPPPDSLAKSLRILINRPRGSRILIYCGVFRRGHLAILAHGGEFTLAGTDSVIIATTESHYRGTNFENLRERMRLFACRRKRKWRNVTRRDR